jgi:hypothetical protein
MNIISSSFLLGEREMKKMRQLLQILQFDLTSGWKLAGVLLQDLSRSLVVVGKMLQDSFL